jgi:sortase A
MNPSRGSFFSFPWLTLSTIIEISNIGGGAVSKTLRNLGVVLIVSGLVLTAIPMVRYAQGMYYQSQEQAAIIEEAPLPNSEANPVVNEDPVDTQALPKANGILEIPKIDLEVVVVQGVTQEDLRRGPGFYPHSWHPEHGNVSIAAHRTGYVVGWFRYINKLDEGDEILLTLAGKLYRYTVREQFVTHDRDWDIIKSVGQAELTLTTCLLTTNKKRLVVKADLASVENIQPEKLEKQ